ncbi:SseB family protein [Fusobacterium russii]|uniref:SseB family protein n=1 Tax=Fusobacterium russii TaxID=854 RepID=UPI0003A01FA9|nr:SseB family protein [Fusobacterium russii]
MKIDVNKPLENPVLKDLFQKLKKAKEDDEYAKVLNNLAEEIAMNAYFLSVVELSEEPEKQNDGSFILKEDTEISFPMLSNQENQTFYPIFIDWEELYKWEDLKKENLKTAIFNFDDYLSMVFNNENNYGIVINPFSDNFLLDKENLKIWKAIKEARIKESGKSEVKN